ncbi:hypothetical protein [Streptomyces sp. CAU 1734]|uniref:hypothetical protein n=1 Tax=Streptomyces sp. CAU 1734 TaxID=3140360 RepID=UPI0032604EB9
MSITTHALPHDDYISAVTDALTCGGLDTTDHTWTDDCDTRGTYCYLNAVLTLDPSGTVTSGDDAERSNWPYGLLLIWEWHTGAEADQGEPERGPQWLFAELRSDGSNEYPTELPVPGYASPAAVVDAARQVISREIRPGSFHTSAQPQWAGGIIGAPWDGATELNAACEAWGAAETHDSKAIA